jgi:type 1 glutamine amidotransferase
MRLPSLTPGSFAFAVAFAACAHAQTPARSTAASRPALRVLMFVGGVAHDYNALPRQLVHNLGRDGDLDIRITADLADLRDDVLRQYDAISFNTCLDTKLTEAQRNAIVSALRAGKGLVAVHCAYWSFQDWPEWRKMIGGLVLTHDKFGPYDDVVVDRGHPIVAGLPARFTVTDEAYYVEQPGDDIHVIVQTADVHKGRKAPEPQAWTTRSAGGRVFAITLGHDAQVQENPAFLTLLANGIRWAGGRLGPPTMLSDLERKDGFEPLFDGKTLKGWHCEKEYWKVGDGCLIGDTRPKAPDKYSYAITDKSYGDFVLRWSVKLGLGNSGVQFRSEELPKFEVAGYQADVVNLGWGNLHEQNGRRKLVDGWTGKAEKAINLKDWNDMEVTAKGPHMTIKVNGVTTADYTETDASKPKSGIIALQLHKGEPTEVWFTNMRIKPLK